jgi:hemoglobin
MTQTLTEADIERLVRRFYERARADAHIGPVFEAAIHDWEAHMLRLTDFWSSVMLGAGRYKGNPFGAHRPLPLEPEMFEAWLGLWRQTTAELFEPPVAQAFVEKAERMASSLTAGLFFRTSEFA